MRDEQILAPLPAADRAAVERLRAFIFDAPRADLAQAYRLRTTSSVAEYRRQVDVRIGYGQPYAAAHAAIMAVRAARSRDGRA